MKYPSPIVKLETTAHRECAAHSAPVAKALTVGQDFRPGHSSATSVPLCIECMTQIIALLSKEIARRGGK